jgi:hypothetical protein
VASYELKEDHYLEWIDRIGADAHQLQAFSTDRHLLSELGLDSVIIFVCGGVAHGVLGKFGQLLTEASITGLRRVWTRRKRLEDGVEATDVDASEEPALDDLQDEAIDAIEAILAVIEEIDPWEAQLLLQAEFLRLGLERDTAKALSKRLLNLPPN